MDILIVNPGEIRHDYITEHLGIASLTAYVNSKGYSAEQLNRNYFSNLRFETSLIQSVGS